MELGLILVVLMSNSFINILIWYFLNRIITLLAALSAGIKTESSCSLLKVSFTSVSLRISVLVIKSSVLNLRYVPQLIP